MSAFLEMLVQYWTVSRPFIAGSLCFVGAILTIISAIGVLRFPDFYTRLHAASITDTLALFLLLAGMAVWGGWSIITLKLLFIGLFILITSPTTTYATANAAYGAGLQPLVGKNWYDDTVITDDVVNDGSKER